MDVLDRLSPKAEAFDIEAPPASFDIPKKESRPEARTYRFVTRCDRCMRTSECHKTVYTHSYELGACWDCRVGKMIVDEEPTAETVGFGALTVVGLFLFTAISYILSLSIDAPSYAIVLLALVVVDYQMCHMSATETTSQARADWKGELEAHKKWL